MSLTGKSKERGLILAIRSRFDLSHHIKGLIWTVDPSQWRGIRDQELDMTKIIDIRNPDFAICDITIQSQPLNQEGIWTVDLTPYRSFIDWGLKVSRTHIAKWQNRDKIWAVGSGESKKDQ